MDTSTTSRTSHSALLLSYVADMALGLARVGLAMVFAAFLLAAIAHAQAIIAPAGMTIFSRESLVRSFTEINRFSLDSDGNSISGTNYITPLAVVYGFRPNWEVIAVQPYVVANITTRTAGQVQHTSLNGFADSQFFLQYDGLYHHNSPGGTTLLSGIFGVQAPTGAERFSTGAFEYTGGLIFEKATNLRYYLTSDFEYTFATANNQKLSRGDSARFDLVPAYMLLSGEGDGRDEGWFRNAYNRIFRNGAFLILEFNGSWQGHATTGGAEMPNSGGTTLSISPGIQYFPSRTLILEFSLPVPVVTELNGIQPEPRTSFLVGFRYLF